jgi:hypothetical protein
MGIGIVDRLDGTPSPEDWAISTFFTDSKNAQVELSRCFQTEELGPENPPTRIATTGQVRSETVELHLLTGYELLDRISPVIRSVIKACVALGNVLAVILSLSSCGSTTPSAVVVRVGNESISKAMLEHWTAVEAVLAYSAEPRGPAPEGVIPDPPRYAHCVAYLGTASPPAGKAEAKPTTTQLKRACQQRYEALQHHVLDILITDDWLSGEGAAKGVTVSAGEVGQAIARQFPTRADYQRFLRLTGEKASDEQLLIRGDLLSVKLGQLRESAVLKSGRSQAQERSALERIGAEYTARWTARTDCRPGYVVQECRQFKGSRTT